MQAQALNIETCLDKPDGMAADPIYRQVALLLEQDIRSHLKPGDLLASEMKLASRFKVNRHTVRRSIDQLVRAGLVVKQQGRGTQVVSNQIEYEPSKLDQSSLQVGQFKNIFEPWNEGIHQNGDETPHKEQRSDGDKCPSELLRIGHAQK